MKLWIVEGAPGGGDWSPFQETGSTGSLPHGLSTLRGRIEDALGVMASGTLLPGDRIPAHSAPQLLITPGYLPDPSTFAREVREGLPGMDSIRLTTEKGEVVGWILPASWSGTVQTLPESPVQRVVAGHRLPGPWALPLTLGDTLSADFAQSQRALLPLELLPPQVVRLGEHPIGVEGEVHLDPFVVLDTRKGPIHLGHGVRIRAHTLLEGPATVGEGSELLGGSFGGIAVGPVCRLRGEIRNSVITGWCNKAHDGYLGHSVLGRWVNLGAFTTTSDLKNTYGTTAIRRSDGSSLDTGEIKVGAFFGDHVKTAIGSLISGGTVVGAGSSLLTAGGLAPRWVPPFMWALPRGLSRVRLPDFLLATERAMARRGMSLEAVERARLEALWEASGR